VIINYSFKLTIYLFYEYKNYNTISIKYKYYSKLIYARISIEKGTSYEDKKQNIDY
jgi:hypothetical protein